MLGRGSKFYQNNSFNINFFVIARNPELGCARTLVEMNPTSPPELSKQLRDLRNSQKTKISGTKILEEVSFTKLIPLKLCLNSPTSVYAA